MTCCGAQVVQLHYDAGRPWLFFAMLQLEKWSWLQDAVMQCLFFFLFVCATSSHQKRTCLH